MQGHVMRNILVTACITSIISYMFYFCNTGYLFDDLL